MAVYVVASLKFTDEARYRRYQRAFADAFPSSGGELLVSEEAPKVLEGEWTADKVVVMRFPSEADAKGWLTGPAYTAIAADRKAGAQTAAVLVRAL